MFDLKIGFSCNNNCIHCVVADKRSSGSLSIPKICAIIDSIPEKEPIVFTGGEPSTYDYLPFLLKFASEKGHPCWIQTNGTGFAEKSFTEECAPYIFNAHVAIHSYLPEIHNSIVQDETGTMWEKTIQGFENLKEFGVPCMTTQTVVSRYNIETTYDTFRWIQDRWPDTGMSFTYPHMMGNALKNAKEICFRYSEYKEEIHRIYRDFHSHLFSESIPYCYQHPFVDQIESIEKDLIKGYQLREGVDFSQGMSTIDYSIKDLQGRGKTPTCKKCQYNFCCPGVWKEYIYLFKNQIDLFPIIGDVNADPRI